MNSEHSRHDRLLVARHAAGDSFPTERDQAERLVAGCDECAALAADIQLITARTSQMTQVRRPRDFRISPEQAEQLHGSWLDRMLRGISAPGWTVVRPLAGAALAIGMALVVIGALPLSNMAGGASQSGALAPVAADNVGGMPTSQTVAALPSQEPPARPTSPSYEYSPQSPSAPGAGQTASPPEKGTITPDANVSAESSPVVDVKTGSPNPTQAPENNPTTAQATSVPSTPAPTDPGQQFGAVKRSTTPDAAGQAGGAGTASLATTTQAAFDRNALINIGLVLAFLGLLVLGIVWGLRSRYSDPLAR